MSNLPVHKKSMLQVVKYLVVGVMNTLLTLIVIFICKSYFEINPYVSNAIGYVVGLINSFIWNRNWVFRSNGRITRQAVHFVTAFVLCYAVQFAVVWTLNQFVMRDILWNVGGFTLSGYGVATLIGNVCYSTVNFVYNKMLTFK